MAIERYIRAKMAISAQRPDASRVFANQLLHGAPVDSVHLFFTIWAATQTYADFAVQVSAVLGHPNLSVPDYARATEHVVTLILRGCGLLKD